jgi:uncharacterized repeat protein (TIGR04138 family)
MLTDAWEKLYEMVEKDRRYKTDAYFFVLDALDNVIRKDRRIHHVSGKQLLASIEHEAIEQFGPMASTVLEHWGIEKALDFGQITFNMVGQGILLKRDTDTLQDFEDAEFMKRLKRKEKEQ